MLTVKQEKYLYHSNAFGM